MEFVPMSIAASALEEPPGPLTGLSFMRASLSAGPRGLPELGVKTA